MKPDGSVKPIKCFTRAGGALGALEIEGWRESCSVGAATHEGTKNHVVGDFPPRVDCTPPRAVAAGERAPLFLERLWTPVRIKLESAKNDEDGAWARGFVESVDRCAVARGEAAGVAQ